MITITSGDFLAGGGGVTEAMMNIPGLKVKWVLNHDSVAIRTNMHNHKGVKHFLADFYRQDEHEMEPVDFVWASIECTQHSRANGGREKKIGSYTLGMELIRYIKHLQPMVVGIENVPEFKDWSPLLPNGKPDINSKGKQFEVWKDTICSLGYKYSELICNAADYGIPTRRVRYFAFFTKNHLQMKINWPKPTHSKEGKNGFKKWVACRNYINMGNEGESIFGRELNPHIQKGKRKPLSVNTLKRIAGGIKKYAPELAFVFQYYGNGLNVQSIHSPLNTVTTKDRHILVTLEKVKSEDPQHTIVSQQKHQFISAYFEPMQGSSENENPAVDFDIRMRFLDPEELSRISTFPNLYFTHPLLKLNKKEQTRLIGNAVPPRWAQIMIEPVIRELQEKLKNKQ